MSQLLELEGEIIDRIEDASSRLVLLVKGSSKWALYERTENGKYQRITRLDRFIFFDKKSPRVAVVESDSVIIVKVFRGPRGKKGSTGRRGCRGISGAPGVSGSTGLSGSPGAPGAPGVSGAPGAEGVSGSPGAEGVSGTPGAEGVSGAPGAEGVSGAPGAEGVSGAPGESISGAPGATGPSGTPGAQGVSGAPGEGISGTPGATGPSGTPGAQGVSGAPGEGISGTPGATGPSGTPGAQGVSGAPGESISGAPGATGPSGTPGAQGISGAPGAQGVSGAPGEGISGAPGAAGLSGSPGESGNSVYGFIYNTISTAPPISGMSPPPPPPQQILSPATNPTNDAQLVIFNSIGLLNGVSFNGTNALTLPLTGDYLANYSVSFISGSPQYSIKLVDDTTGLDIPGSDIISNSPVLNGSVEFSATAGDQISLANNKQNFATLATSYATGTTPTPTVTLVNSTVADTSPSGSTTITTSAISFAAPTSIYVCIQCFAGITTFPVVSVTDNVGGTYTEINVASQSDVNKVFVYYRDNIPFNQNVEVTVTFNTTLIGIVELLQFTNTNTPSNSTGGIIATGTSTSPGVIVNPTLLQQFMLLTVVTPGTNELTDGNVPIVEKADPSISTEGAAGGANPITIGSQTIDFTLAPSSGWTAIGVLIDPVQLSDQTLNTAANASLGVILLRQPA